MDLWGRAKLPESVGKPVNGVLSLGKRGGQFAFFLRHVVTSVVVSSHLIILGVPSETIQWLMYTRRQATWPPVPIEQIRLMGAVADTFSLTDPNLVYEPKYDGIRVKVFMDSNRSRAGVTIWSRTGNVMTAQFPDVVDALTAIRRSLKASVVLDGEIVAIDQHGNALKFEDLQSRLGVLRPTARTMAAIPVSFIVFDMLWEGEKDLRPQPLISRRQRLERLLPSGSPHVIRLSRYIQADGQALMKEAQRQDWEGVVAKRLNSPYRSGVYHPDWKKWKLVLQQEFVVGGWTESDRRPFRALLIGVYGDDGGLHYVGRMGKAFSDSMLKDLAARLHALEISASPFCNRPDPDATPHWARPELVIEAKFTEWTKSGKLREPTFIGLRPDVEPKTVRREPTPGSRVASHAAKMKPTDKTVSPLWDDTSPLLGQLDEIEQHDGTGVLTFEDGQTLHVTHLNRVMWPTLRITKGGLMRYYIGVAPFLLPTIEDRPVTYRPFPHGVEARPDRYHQRVKHPVPKGVRVESFRGTAKDYEARFIGGSLVTLLYMVQLDIISQDAWLSTVQTPDHPDLAVIDLDPMPDVLFQQVADVARWLHDELETLGVPHFLKTSGASGLHVFLPLAPNTSFRESWQFCQLLSQLVTRKHSRQATVERTVSTRGKRVYLDYLQNLPGKTIATAYSVRANRFAGVSTPLRWEELSAGVRAQDFTMQTVPGRLKARGDLWAALRQTLGIDLHTTR